MYVVVGEAAKEECEGSLIEDSLSGPQGSLSALFFFNQGILLQVVHQNEAAARMLEHFQDSVLCASEQG